MENTYAIRATRDAYLGACKTNPITFQAAESGLALPNPDYLRIHTACCRVAHLSGAAKHMNKIIEDLENMQVLSRMARLHISCLLLYNLLVKNMFN